MEDYRNFEIIRSRLWFWAPEKERFYFEHHDCDFKADDGRCGYGPTVGSCKRQIDNMIDNKDGTKCTA